MLGGWVNVSPVSLDAEPQSPAAPQTVSAAPAAEFRLHSVGINQGLFPGRGLLYSLLAHEIAVFLLLLPPVIHRAYAQPPKQWELTMVPNNDVLYLPQLGGGNEGGGHHSASAKAPPAAGAASIAARSAAGVSYPGTQEIVSNPPNPTNFIQTIQQPQIPNPPILRSLVPLPNVVKLVAPSPPPLPPGSGAENPPAETARSASEVRLPVMPPLDTTPVRAPKLTLPHVAGGTNIPLEALASPPPPPKPVASKPQVLPGMEGTDRTSLLVLSPIPAPAASATEVPRGEARGQFAVTPLPNLAMSNLGSGAVMATLGRQSVGVGIHPDATAHDATGTTNTASPGGGAGVVPGGEKPGTGPAAGLGGAGKADAGSGAGGAGSGAGTGSGPSAGHGRGTGGGSGTGGGAGPGTGAFPGITIQGGEWAQGMPAGLAPHQSSEAQKEDHYALTVVSSGNSGGGLGDFGVFSNEPVYTVYINMDSSADDPAPSWTLQYAALPGGSAPGALAPPFPIKKQTPSFPAELAGKYRGQLIVVYAVIDPEGNVQELKTMQSPNVRLGAILLAAVAQWTFRPAALNGKPVAVKTLLGVPIVPGP